MKLTITGKLPDSPRNLIRRLGYGEHFDHNTNQFSYSKRLSTGRYPRFHAYIDELPDGFKINLHLDQKQASYQGHTAHSGEYDSPLVKQEIERIKSDLAKLT